MIRQKIQIMEALKQAGYTAYRLRKEKVFGEMTIQKFRDGGIPSPAEMNKLCKILGLQPGDLIEYVPDKD